MRHVIVLDESDESEDVRIINFTDFLNMGNQFEKDSESNFEDLTNIANPEDLLTLIYTSGTTGNPKGVLINHLNILADSFAISNNFKFNQKTRTLCILPLFHNNGQIATFFSPLYTGGSTVITFGKTNIYNFWNYVDKF